MIANSLAERPRGRSIAATILSVLLLLAFLGAAAGKLTTQPMMVAEFGLFGLPLWFMYLIGITEITAAILVVIPRTSRIGAALMIFVTLGATFEHLTHGQTAMAAGPFILLLLAAALLWLRGGTSAPLSASAKDIPQP